ncbi:putative chloramphenical resistance permease RarD [Kingella potus]|uniref:Putative chloramphenical resistance permease RarD n=1 Tax=Kingella potus TaxID=265175 RepID=A0A377R1B8_9NEIS|nr:EamA family transporter RarD [Kingella potus]STR00889.1 putative chloramphenical resistance permease RarD [Kingella potus]
MTADLSDSAAERRRGLRYALGCYAVWGLFPLYWYPLKGAVPAGQMLAQRVVWSALFALLLLLWYRQGGAVLAVLRRPRLLAAFAASSLFIGANWLVYLWAITNGHVLDASLGYFANPLFNVFLGFVVLKERLDRTRWAAVALALAGILWLAVPAGQVPWIALLLAGSFGSYALIRKLAPMDALPGLALETFLLLPFAAAYLAWCVRNGTFVAAGSLSVLQNAVLLGSGAATTLPLLMFAAGAKRISLSLLGILQYFSPTIQLLLGLVLFGETLDGSRLAGYALVWLGVAVFLSGVWREGRRAAVKAV